MATARRHLAPFSALWPNRELTDFIMGPPARRLVLPRREDVDRSMQEVAPNIRDVGHPEMSPNAGWRTTAGLAIWGWFYRGMLAYDEADYGKAA